MECPTLLYIAQSLASYEDFFDQYSDHLVQMLDWYEQKEDENNALSPPIAIFLKILLDKMGEVNRDIASLKEELPNMSLDQWKIFNERWSLFLQSMNDIKLNKK